MPSRSFLSHAVVYGLGTMLVNAAGFFLLPLYTRCLTPAEYGTLEVLNRMGEIVGVCLLFGGIRQATLAFLGQSDTQEERQHAASSAVVLLLAVTLAGACFVILAAGALGRCLEGTDAALLRLAIVACLLEGMSFALLAIPQARLESALYVGITVSQFLVRMGLCVFLVVGLHWGIWGVLLASGSVGCLYGLGLAGRELMRGGWTIDRRQLGNMVRFALPFMPAGLGFFLLNSGDRFFLLAYGGQEAVGRYALGYKLALAVGIFARTPLCMVWSARMYEVAKQPDAPEFFGQVFTRIQGAFLLVGLGLCIFQDEVVDFLGGARYADAAAVIAPVVLAYFFAAAADLMDAGFFVRRRTMCKTWIALASTIVMLALYALLIPHWRALGAALATLGGFLFHAGLTFVASQRVFPVRYQHGRLLGMVSLAIGLWLLSRLIPAGSWFNPLKVGLWAAWPASLWLAGLISAEEKHWTRCALRRGLARVAALRALRPVGGIR